MAFETKPNTGVLFHNTRKEKEAHPDWKGNVIVNGKPMDIAAWTKTSKGGSEYLSLSFQEPRQRTETKPERQAFDDDIPL